MMNSTTTSTPQLQQSSEPESLTEIPHDLPVPEVVLTPGVSFPELIDNTARSSYTKCGTYFYWGTIRHLRLAGGNIHLHAGGSFAKGLEVARRAFYERGASLVNAEEEGLKALYDEYAKAADLEPAKYADKSVEGMVRAYEAYMLQYPFGSDSISPLMLPSGRAAVEFSFAVPLPIMHPETGNPLLYGGRFDMLGLYNKSLFIVDEKTASQLGDQWMRNWDLDSQNTGYVWGSRQYGFPVAGAINRGVGLLKTKTTFAEAINYRPQWMIDRWFGQLLWDIEDMISCWKNKRFRFALDKSACNAYGGCSYKTLCESPTPERWIAAHYVEHIWNPLA